MDTTINRYPCSKFGRATRMHYDCFQRIGTSIIILYSKHQAGWQKKMEKYLDEK